MNEPFKSIKYKTPITNDENTVVDEVPFSLKLNDWCAVFYDGQSSWVKSLRSIYTQNNFTCLNVMILSAAFFKWPTPEEHIRHNIIQISPKR